VSQDHIQILIIGDGAAQGPLGIMQTMPAIGVLLLRADVATDLDAAADVLPAIRQMRVRLGLLPGDAAETTYTQWHAAKAKAGDVDARSRGIAEAKAEADALRGTIADTVRQNRDLARRIEDLERQLRERPTAPPPVEIPADPAELRALRARLEQLQEVVREKNLELAELRRDFRSGRAEDPDPASNGATDPSVVDNADDRWIESDGGSDRRTRIPTWRPTLLADVQSMPPHVTREAIRTAPSSRSATARRGRRSSVPRELPNRCTWLGLVFIIGCSLCWTVRQWT
jgi:hypothetical protein